MIVLVYLQLAVARLICWNSERLPNMQLCGCNGFEYFLCPSIFLQLQELGSLDFFGEFFFVFFVEKLTATETWTDFIWDIHE